MSNLARRSRLAAALRADGCQVDAVADEIALLRLLERRVIAETEPQVVLIDLRLPHASGSDVIQLLRDAQASSPTLDISRFDLEAIRRLVSDTVSGGSPQGTAPGAISPQPGA